jgi:diguanylate cyclase (GGDEF)-like protein
MNVNATTRSRPGEESRISGRGSEAAPALVIYASHDPALIGRRIELTGEVTIGRAEDNAIIISADTVSRSHARLTQRGRSWVLVDAGSANGTFLHDEPIDEQTLRPNDLFKIGPTIFKFISGDVEAAYHETIHHLATTDGLTGAANRRAFEETLVAEVRRALRYQRPLSLVMFDLDHFKRVNDNWGHMAGDLVLATTASLVRKTARAEDCVARYGGEEFALILPETSLAAAATLAEKIRTAVMEHLFLHEDQKIPVTVSLGVAEVRPPMQTGKELVRAADEKLYEAKRTGRNRVCT